MFTSKRSHTVMAEVSHDWKRSATAWRLPHDIVLTQQNRRHINDKSMEREAWCACDIIFEEKAS